MSSSQPDRPSRHDPDDLVLWARSHTDLIATVAAMLGYHPADSLAVVAMSGPRVRVVLRADLPGAAAAQQDHLNAAGTLLRHAIRNGATDVVLLGYGPREAVDPVMMAALSAADTLAVRDAIRVTDGRYFTYLCRDIECSTPAGVPFDLTTSPVMAQAVFAGMAVLPDRAAVADTVAPITGPQLQAMRQAVITATQHLGDIMDRDGVEAAIQAGSQTLTEVMARYEAGGRCDDAEMARLLVALINPDVRADAWYGSDNEAWQEDLWRDATRRSVTFLVATPASLLAFTAWRRGNSTLARIAVDRALRADDSHQMAQLMQQVLDSNMAPSQFPGWGLLGGNAP